MHAVDGTMDGPAPRRRVTTPERKALLFFAAVALLGAAARLVADRREHATPPLSRRALATQLDAVDSARDAARSRKRERKPSPRSRPRPRGKGTAVVARPVDVDVADSAALESLPGVGPALAARVVADRVAGGAFGSLTGLERVRGIGPTLAKRLAPHVTFSGIPRPPSAADGSRSRHPSAAAQPRRDRRP